MHEKYFTTYYTVQDTCLVDSKKSERAIIQGRQFKKNRFRDGNYRHFL